MNIEVGVADNDEQAALADAVRRALARQWTSDERQKRISDPASVTERPLWATLTELGVPGLPVPEDLGGSGGTWSDLGVALEAAGAVLAPTPAVGVAGALGALEQRSGTDAARLRTGLVTGATIATVAWADETAEPVEARTDGAGAQGNTVLVTGGRDLLLTPEADTVILLATSGEGPLLVAVETNAEGVTVQRHDGLDLTRPTGTLILRGALATVLAAGETAVAAERRSRVAGGAALANELVGAVAHCLAGAVSYAADREQFGRPIGAFQAVKHRCADVLAALELARAAARAVTALLDDAGADPDALDDAVALALLQAGRALHEASNGYIQTLGGVGFTWEHEAHLYFRRSGASAAFFGGADAHLARLDPVAAGAAKPPTFTGPAAELAAQVDALLPAHRAKWGDDDSFAARLDWQRTLHAVGWIAPQWPTEFGGKGLDIVDQVRCDNVLAVRGAPALAGVLGVNNVAPTLMHWGTPEQQQHLAGIQAGTEVWCQGFSEPGAGSDLASLRTKAVLVGEGDDREFVVTGQKIWTSEGMEADYCLLLVRTDPDARPHKGISALLVPLDLPGITRRPITQITGEGGFAELFFDEVRAPYSRLLGPLHGGWTVTMTTLAFERSGVIMMAGRLEQEVREAVDELSGRDLPSGVRLALTDRLVEARLLGALGERALGRIAAGGAPGPEHSVIKLAWSLASTHLGETRLAALGPDAVTAPVGRAARHGYLLSRASTIAGGTTDIMRNILAERVLGMPR
ncbi:acyl-CoA dehydrogenase [Cryptosporangium aurantiacum]|uniref:Acyl-CoA dehydrogenase n=1 Tax=Cryptosporangium aurantiacum TaxID=134849 RepID=A0A1M7PMH1_9ACTN|nr:acyl-CoA dehydrogenase [Cryptosporangium aurantiacum]SHN18382.1 Acyl-CoA dehydrogenase [Cryptosporangium aurantiacum]